MKKTVFALLLVFIACQPVQALELKVKMAGVEDGKPIAERFAYCVSKPDNKAAEGQNISPGISWDKGPEGTKSYAVIVVDRDVPLNMDDNNKDGKKIVEYAPRQNFYHWVLVNIPANITAIDENMGKDKKFGDQLINDYLKFSGVKKNAQTIKKFTGYDGPCPPWNDERMHNYHFKVYALSDRFTYGEDYNGDDIIRIISPCILAQGEVIGTYTLNPDMMPKPAVAEPAAKSK